MSSKEAFTDILRLAVAFYRSPIRYQSLLQTQAGLPKDADLLLQIAGGDPYLIEKGCEVTGAGIDELRKAVVFFIEQVFLNRDASHYRVLGLNPDATPDQIKEHHRLLMRLFHPDRRGTQETWTDVYASRINQAYNVLRKPGLRHAYDASRGATPQRSWNRTLPADYGGLVKAPAFAAWAQLTSMLYLPPFVLRHLSQAVLGGIGLLAILLVCGVYLLSQQTPLPKPAKDQITVVPQLKTAAKVVSNETLQAPSPTNPSRAEIPPNLTSAHTKKMPIASDDQYPIFKFELEALISQFITAYEQGDLEQFMALFANQARTNKSTGKAGITRDYARLFRTTQDRQLIVSNLHWRREGALVRGNGRFLVRARDHGERQLGNRSGTIHFEIVKHNGRILIRQIFYVLDTFSQSTSFPAISETGNGAK